MPGLVALAAVAMAYDAVAMRRGVETISGAIWRIRRRAPWLITAAISALAMHALTEGGSR
jgi:hypothetical protein